ncbi:pyridoxal 5'-phosphate synthase glutaminase subunit PdxT [Corynebacterium sp. AOP40-9SA-29]|uniref:pyridoxal 5'-phosphate synthase glutaminase subunit PdxT n=1 Tax=Corynebacterium sp. AOP40-9SA-29 TaxID=3457677 RepID=UPI004034E293
MSETPLIGVLALQGGVVEHVRMLEGLGARTRLVRRPAQLEGLDGLVFPGGESTTMSKLMELGGMLEPLRAVIADGLPCFGTCAGLILLGSEILDTRADAHCLNALDVTVRRNAFGRQVDSFETDLDVVGVTGVAGEPVHAVFIRAPWVERVGDDVEVLSRVDDGGPAHGAVVAVRQGPVLGLSFHPELTGDDRLHRYFLTMVGESLAARKAPHHV